MGDELSSRPEHVLRTLSLEPKNLTKKLEARRRFETVFKELREALYSKRMLFGVLADDGKEYWGRPEIWASADAELSIMTNRAKIAPQDSETGWLLVHVTALQQLIDGTLGQKVDTTERAAQTRREFGKQRSMEKYLNWNELAQKLKAKNPNVQSIELARLVARQSAGETGNTPENILRRLNQHFPGWSH